MLYTFCPVKKMVYRVAGGAIEGTVLLAWTRVDESGGCVVGGTSSGKFSILYFRWFSY